MRRPYTKKPPAVDYDKVVQAAAVMAVQSTVNRWLKDNKAYSVAASSVCGILTHALGTPVKPQSKCASSTVATARIIEKLRTIENPKRRGLAQQAVLDKAIHAGEILRTFETLVL